MRYLEVGKTFVAKMTAENNIGQVVFERGEAVIVTGAFRPLIVDEDVFIVQAANRPQAYLEVSRFDEYMERAP